MTYLVKSSATPGLTAKANTLVDAKAWVAERDKPAAYSIWKFVGSNPNNQNHYTCVQTEGN